MDAVLGKRAGKSLFLETQHLVATLAPVQDLKARARRDVIREIGLDHAVAHAIDKLRER